MTFQTTLHTHFPHTCPEQPFIDNIYKWLRTLNFTPENSLACVSRCRDELTYSLLETIQQRWGAAFDLATLGGFLFVGKTGFSAAIHHAPTHDGRTRYLFFAFPHIGIDEMGEIGCCHRPGQADRSTACGALVAIQQELEQAPLDPSLDMEDIELSLIRRRLAPLIEDKSTDLISLTQLAHKAISADLHQLIGQMVDPTQSDYALFTGIQIHGAAQQTFIWPGVSYAVVKNQKYFYPTTLPGYHPIE